RRFIVRGERVPVGDEVEARILALQLHPVLECAVEMSQVHRDGGAHAGDHAFFVHLDWMQLKDRRDNRYCSKHDRLEEHAKIDVYVLAVEKEYDEVRTP